MSEFMYNHEAFDEHEQLALLDLIEAVHAKMQQAITYEENLGKVAVDAGQAAERTTNIAVYSTEGNENVKGPHYLVIWKPEYGERPLYGLKRLEVRLPDEAETDLFLRVHDVYDNVQNYLLNHRGITPFNSATTDVEQTHALDPSRDQFVVKDDIVCVPSIELDVFTLDMINAAYKYKEQPRKTDHSKWDQAS